MLKRFLLCLLLQGLVLQGLAFASVPPTPTPNTSSIGSTKNNKKPSLNKCLKDKSSVIALDKLAKDTASNIKKTATADYSKVLNSSKVLSRLVTNVTSMGETVSDDAEKDFWQTYRNYKESVRFVEGLDRYVRTKTDTWNALDKKRRERIDTLIANSNKFSIKSASIAVNGAIKKEGEGYTKTFNDIDTAVESLQSDVDELEKFDPTTKEGWNNWKDTYDGEKKATEEELKGAEKKYHEKLTEINKKADGISENLKTVLNEKNASFLQLDATLSFVTSLKTKSSGDEIIASSNSAGSDPRIKQSVVSEAKVQGQNVKAGSLTLPNFREWATAVEKELQVQKTNTEDAINHAQEAINGINDLKKINDDEKNSSSTDPKMPKVPNTKDVMDKSMVALKKIQDGEAKLQSKALEIEATAAQYQRIAESPDPKAVAQLIDGELVQEMNAVQGDMDRYSGMYSDFAQRKAYWEAMMTQAVPAYVAALTKISPATISLAVGNAALAKARGYMDLSMSGTYAQAATTQIFTVMQPVIGCLAPYWRYITLATLVTGKQFNLANFARATKPQNTRSAKCSGIKVGGVCYVTKDKKVIRAAGQSKKVYQFITSTLDEAKGSSSAIISELQSASSMIEAAL